MSAPAGVRFPGVGDTVTFVSSEGDAIRTGVVAARRGVHLRVMDVLEPLSTGETWRWSEWIRWPDSLVNAPRQDRTCCVCEEGDPRPGAYVCRDCMKTEGGQNAG